MSATIELGAALVMGLMGTVHCVGMCGGIASVLSAGPQDSCRSPSATASGAIATNLGRLGTYALLGALAGALGGAFRGAIPLAALGTGARVATALVLVVVGLQLAGVGKGLSRISSLGRPLFARVRSLLAAPATASLGASLLRGMGWGLLPCGLVYGAAALAVVAGDSVSGALTMLAFGAGTLPSMLAVGAFASSFVRLVKSERLRATAGILVAASGAVHLAIAVLQVGALPHVPPAGSEERPCCASRALEGEVPHGVPAPR
jgi:sulfite exporter TauE/SafE